MIRKMVMEFINGLMGMNIEDNLLMTLNMDMEKCIIKMVQKLKGIGNLERLLKKLNLILFQKENLHNMKIIKK